jgi:hypothetical protein
VHKFTEPQVRIREDQKVVIFQQAEAVQSYIVDFLSKKKMVFEDRPNLRQRNSKPFPIHLAAFNKDWKIFGAESFSSWHGCELANELPDRMSGA